MDIMQLIETQYFLVNLATDDIADVMMELEDHEEDEEYDEETADLEYVNELMEEHNLNFEKLNNSIAEIVYENKKLYISFDKDTKNYQLSLLEYLGFPIYQKLTDFFRDKRTVILIEPSIQIGGIIDKNYGFKFKIKISS